MKVELHLHTCRYSFCAVDEPEQVMLRAQEAGYDAVYITEHDAVWSAGELQDLRGLFPRLQIFCGLEKTLGSHHLLILGTCDRAYLRMDDPGEVLDKARRDGHLTVLAHPFRWDGGADVLRVGLLPDAVEYRTGNQNARQAAAAEAVARRLDLPVVSAGDVHALDFVDRYWIETQRDVHQANDIRQIVRDGAYANCCRE